MRWWHRITARPATRDAAIAVLWLLVGLVLFAIGGIRIWAPVAVVDDAPPGVFLATLLAMTAIATQRSRHPLLALTAGTAVAVIDVLCGGSLGVVVVMTDLAYSAVNHGSSRAVRMLLRGALGAALVVAVVLLVLRPDDPAIVTVAVQWALILSISGLWGWNVRSERLLTRTVMTVQHATETRELRHRIAHELHDLVANQIAVAGLHVEAAKLQADRIAAPGGSAALQSSLDQAKRGTDQAHRELRNLIGVLTASWDIEDPAPARPDEQLAALGRLLPAGRRLSWRGAGRAGLLSALEAEPESRARVVLRVLEELVANAAKHGEGEVAVSVGPDAGGADALAVEVHNRRGRGDEGAPVGGLGIGAARLLLGGVGATLEAAAEGAEWRAAIRLPRSGGGGS